MNIIIADTFETLSAQVADKLVELIADVEEPLISPASGDSPAGLYAELVKKFERKELNIAKWKFVGLDEWLGMNGVDEGSCRYHLNNQLFGPLQIVQENICFFDGRAGALDDECSRADNFILDNGGLDVAIIGLGMNGHVGMNEPGTDPALYAHATDIDPITQYVGQKYFTSKKKLLRGITLGIATLMEARNIILLVTGAHKADIVHRFFEATISPELPVTLFRNHPGLFIYLDKAAAQLVQLDAK